MSDTISFYDQYKPLRNRLREIDLQNLLIALHGLQHTMGDKVQENFRNVVDGTSFVANKWDIHRLVREAIINCPTRGSAKQVDKKDISKLLLYLGEFKSHLEKSVLTSPSAALDMLHPMLHHQFSFQQPNDLRRLYRAFKIYGDDLLSQKVHDVLGLSLQSIFKLTYAVAGAARSSLFINAQNYFDFDGIGQKTVEAYFSMMSTSLEKLREEMMGLSRYDKRWLYTWNPLEARPLVRPNPVWPHLYWCPCPELMIRRSTDGLFFDLVDKDGDFGNPYGKAFQNYCGLALHQQFTKPHHRVLEERQYMVNGQKKDGVDWIVSDNTGHLMIECKARRLRLEAKLDANDEAVDEALDVLAHEIKKHYINVSHAIDGHTQWVPDGKPVYLLFVTYEDWYLFAPKVVEQLELKVHQKLADAGIFNLLISMPFFVTSIFEMELAGQAVARFGIDTSFRGLKGQPGRHVALTTHLMQTFAETGWTPEQLYPNAMHEVTASISHLLRQNTFNDESLT